MGGGPLWAGFGVRLKALPSKPADALVIEKGVRELDAEYTGVVWIGQSQ